MENPEKTEPWTPWKPFPNTPQEQAYHSKADEVFFGGAGGGGKSSLAVGLALTRHRQSLILRREASQVADIVTQLQEFAPPGSRWRGNGGGHGGVMRTSDGRTIEVSGVPHEKDKHRFQGRPKSFIDFDEVTEFSLSIVQFISAWLRSTFLDPFTKLPERCRVMLGGNPPMSAEGMWIIDRYKPWLDPDPGDSEMPGVLRWYARIENREERVADGAPIEWRGRKIKPQSRTFIPASLDDNPKLRDTDYASRLALMPAEIRDAILLGDFGVSLRDDAWQVIPSAWIRAAQARWRPDGQNGQPLTRSGLDCIYGGNDRQVLTRRYGDWVAPLDVWSSADIKAIAESEDGNLLGKAGAELVNRVVGGSPAPVNVDVIGYGAATYEALVGMGVKAIPVNFGDGANGIPDARGVLEFANERARFYWTLRDSLDPDLGSELALPPDDVTPGLRAELAATKYERRGGRIFIRPKEEIAAEIGHSPDLADSVALSVGDIPLPTLELLGN